MVCDAAAGASDPRPRCQPDGSGRLLRSRSSSSKSVSCYEGEGHEQSFFGWRGGRPGRRSSAIMSARRTRKAFVERLALIAILAVPALPCSDGKARTVRADDLAAWPRAYAEAMIERGRDTCGAEHSPLFAAALDRRTMRLPEPGELPEIPGVRSHDRALAGANPWHDAELYRLLYALSQRTGAPRFAAEADRALEFFLRRCASPRTKLFAWGEHLSWDFRRETAVWLAEHHEVRGEWPLWDACYRLAAEPCYDFALGQWDHQILDHRSGDFSRHARWSEHGPEGGADFPRYAGQLIVNWADAFSRPGNAARPRCDELGRAIAVLVGRMEQTRRESPIGQLAAFRGAAYGWPGSNLELARCLWKAADLLPAGGCAAELPARMRRLAVELDRDFQRLPHGIGRLRREGVAVDLHLGDPIEQPGPLLEGRP